MFTQCSHTRQLERLAQSFPSVPGEGNGLRSGLDPADLRSEKVNLKEGRHNQCQKAPKRAISVVNKVRTRPKQVFIHCSHTVHTKCVNTS